MKYTQKPITAYARPQPVMHFVPQGSPPSSPSSSSSSTPHSITFVTSALLENGEEVKPGDVVEINEDEDNESFATVLKLWVMDSPRIAYAKIRWYYKPKDVFMNIPRFISRKELYDSDHEQSISVAAMKKVIQVVPAKAFFFSSERSESTRFCRATFIPQTKQLVPSILEWDEICTCKGILNPDLSYIVCFECQAIFHPECVKKPIDSITWICSACRLHPQPVIEVLKLLPPATVLLAASLVSTLWARAALEDELWRELLETESVSEEVYWPQRMKGKRAFQLYVRSRGKLAIFRQKQLALFDCRTETWTVVSLKGLTPGIYCISSFLPTCQLVCSGGLEVSPSQELKSTSSAFIFTFDPEACGRLPNMRIARHSHGMIAHGASVYVFGGMSDDALRASEEYHQTSNQWRPLPDMIRARRLFNPCVSRRSIYLCGGVDSDSIEVFDLVARTYSEVAVFLPLTRCWQCASTTLDNELYYMSGRSLIVISLSPSYAVRMRSAPCLCGWQDSNPQCYGGHLYYQQAGSVAKLDLDTMKVGVIPMPLRMDIQAGLDHKRRSVTISTADSKRLKRPLCNKC